ncbi:MAG: site-2 protease family protein, partial [Victivallales bacterium]|nr:site-2 protease family protein [Victivallales bacterium]
YAIMQLLIIVFSICCHEYMHARTALWQGDDTAARTGHLTLNPLKQMGLISIFMLFMFGIAFGQVPVNPNKMRKPWGEALVSFAGPFANIALFASAHYLFMVASFAVSMLLLLTKSFAATVA